jgi:hypothetical protein
MTRNTDILKELEEISPAVANLNAQTPYSIPAEYFETLASVIMARIAAGGTEENSVLTVAGKLMPQDVPDGYFNNLSGDILSKIKMQNEQSVADELKELSPMLAGISKTNLYEVPAGYFETFTVQPYKSISDSKVVSMFSRKVFMQYAAAAVVFVLIAFGINFFSSQNNIIKETTIVPKSLTDDQFNNELAKISDDEIINYLNQTADSKDAITIATLIDKSELPDEADYMDDEFLNSVMQELEKTDKKTN